MYARVLTSCLYGLSGEPTWVETDVDNGLPGFFMVGLADQAIREAKERIRSAIRSGGHKFPDKRITVNLTPANKKKEGSHFDLPIAIGVLLASESVLCRGDLSKTAFLGELTLDGRVQPIRAFGKRPAKQHGAKQQGQKMLEHSKPPKMI